MGAGRLLRNLYTPPYDPSHTAGSGTWKARWPPEPDTYVAVNGLGVATHGLHFRRSMHLHDPPCGLPEFVPWGACVQGDRVDACWLKVDKLYLPTNVNGITTLQRWQGPGRPPRASITTPAGPPRPSTMPGLGLSAS